MDFAGNHDDRTTDNQDSVASQGSLGDFVGDDSDSSSAWKDNTSDNSIKNPETSTTSRSDSEDSTEKADVELPETWDDLVKAINSSDQQFTWEELVELVNVVRKPSDCERAIGYARRSVEDSEQETSTILEQVVDIIELADQYDLYLVSIIVDDKESGQTMDRPGIRELRRKFSTKKDIEFLIIQHMTRLGRNFPRATNFLEDARVNHEIVLLTNLMKFDFDQPMERSFAGFLAIMADQEDNYRTKQAMSGSKRNFRERQIWRSWHGDNIPFACREAEDEWIELREEYCDIVRRLHETIAEVPLYGSYEKVRKVINDEFSHLFPIEYNGSEITELDNGRIKRTLKNSLYTGYVTIGDSTHQIHEIITDPDRSLTEEIEDIADVYDEELAIIDVETYANSYKKVEKIRRHNRSPNTKLDAYRIVSEFGIDKVLDWRDCIRVECPKCGEKMVEDGTKTSYDPPRQVYKCCDGHFTVFPSDTDLNNLEDTEDEDPTSSDDAPNGQDNDRVSSGDESR